jgi:hypothetical protein
MGVSKPLNKPNPLETIFPQYAGQKYVDVIPFSGPGYGEIKAHNVAGVQRGLAQLRTEYATRAKDADKTKRDPFNGFLLTYDYRLSKKSGESVADVYLLKPKKDYFTEKPPRLDREGDVAWLTKLGTWWSFENPIRITEHSIGEWEKRVGPTVFGSMIEPFLREEFFRKFGKVTRNLTATKPPQQGGSDVKWLEVAEFLYELDVALARAA